MKENFLATILGNTVCTIFTTTNNFQFYKCQILFSKQNCLSIQLYFCIQFSCSSRFFARSIISFAQYCCMSMAKIHFNCKYFVSKSFDTLLSILSMTLTLLGMRFLQRVSVQKKNYSLKAQLFLSNRPRKLEVRIKHPSINTIGSFEKSLTYTKISKVVPNQNSKLLQPCPSVKSTFLCIDFENRF